MFIHPVRVRRWRKANLGLLVVWAVLALVAVLRNLQPSPVVTVGLCAIGLYFFAFGLLQRRLLAS
jgi:phosphatidylcholine synthase